MSNAIKAALLSTFVLPGTGHFVLKKYISGTVLAVSALTSLYLVFSSLLERTFQIADKIQSGEVQPDVGVITELILKQPAGTNDRLLNIAWTVLFVSWLIGIVDSYRIGRQNNGNDSGR